MYLKIADFLIEIEEIENIALPFKLFQVKKELKSPDLKICLQRRGFFSFKERKLIFKAPGFWEIYQNGDKIIFWDRFKGIKPNPGARFAIFDRKLTQGRLFYTNRHQLHPNKHESVNPLAYPIGPLLILNKLSKEEGIFLHACAVRDKEGIGYIFCGRSGAGKTTMAKIWQMNNQGLVLNDDRIIIRKLDNKLYAYGCPWYSRDKDLVSHQKIEINKIFFLKHSKRNSIKLLNKKEGFSKIIQHAYFSIWDKSAINFSFRFLNYLCQQVPNFELGFRPTKEIVDFVKRV